MRGDRLSGDTGLTRAQALALALDRNLSVTAGAGTGKTRVLTRRFLRILQKARDVDALGARGGAPPKKIVAVTFTRKAANEMRERVAEAVTKEVRTAQQNGDDAGYAYWVQTRRELEEATIHTIHGLAARLVRMSALELGVDPKFRVVEGIDARLLVEEAISAVLADPPEDVRRALRELYVLRGPRDVRAFLRALVADRVHADSWADRMSTLGVEGMLDWLWQMVPVDPDEANGLLARVSDVHARLQAQIKVPPAEDAKAAGLLAVLSRCSPSSDPRQAVGTLWELVDWCTTKEGTWYKQANGATGPEREWKAMGLSGHNKEVFNELEEILEDVVGRLHGVPGEADRRMLALSWALAQVHGEVVARYEEMKRRRGLLDYHDLEALARRALARPGVADVLRRRIRYLLVDEFQDTNEDQWAILQALARSPLDGEDEEAQPGASAGAARDAPESGGWATAAELTGEAGNGADAHAPELASPGFELTPDKTDAQLQQEREQGQGQDPEPGPEQEQEQDDGSPMQLVELADAPEQAGDEPLGQDRLFIVGDAKQSIYSFRGADVTVYETSRDNVREANAFHGLDQDPPELDDVADGAKMGAFTEAECQGEVRLDRNFRSLPGLVAFTNRFFDRLLAPEDPGQRQRFEAQPGPLRVQRKGLDAAGGTETGRVRLLVTPRGFTDAVARGDLSAEEADRLGPARYQFARMVQDIRHRVDGPQQGRWVVSGPGRDDETGVESSRPARYQDVAVLLPRRTNLRLLEEQMRTHDVPYVVVGGRGFWSRQEVWDAVNLLAVIAEPQRDVELLSVLRSAFFAWTDEALALLAASDGASLWHRLNRVATGEEGWDPPSSFQGVPPEQVVQSIRRWQARAAATPAARLLMEIFTETPFMAALGAHAPQSSGRMAVENLEKLVSLVRQLEDRRGRSLVPLVRDLLSLAQDDAEEAEAVLPGEEEVGVRVMTVHAAKGLQFPIVYVAELDAVMQGGSLGEARGVEFDRHEGMPLYAFKARGEDGEAEDSFLNKQVRRRARLRSRAEYKRLLYVAATRAQDHLVLVGSSERLGPKPMRRPPTLKELHAGRSWMDWVERLLGLSPGVYEEILQDGERARRLSLTDHDDNQRDLDGEADGDADGDADDGTAATVEVDVGKVMLDAALPAASPAGEDPAGETGGEGTPVTVHPAPPSPVPQAVRVSPSQLLLYAQCKARFRYRVVEGMVEGWVGGVRSMAPPFGETFGSLLHRALASGATRDDPLPGLVQQRAVAMARRFHAEQGGWPAPERVVDLLRTHARQALQALTEELAPGAVLIESGVDAEVTPGVRVVGRLDRVHRDGDGRFVVVDLKTDSVPPGEEEQHAQDHGHDAQVLFYDAALRRAGHDTAPPALLYSATGRLVRVEHPVGGSERDIVAQLGRRVAATQRLDQPDPQELESLWPRSAPGPKTCKACGFWKDNGGPCDGVTVTGP